MKTIDLTLLIPEQEEVTACYRMGLKSLTINGITFPLFAVKTDKKDIFIEGLKDEFGSEFKVEDLSKVITTEKGGIINIIICNDYVRG